MREAVLLTVSHLFASYATAEVLHDIAFTVEQGESLYIAGPNGCGKTTLLKCIAGLLPYKGYVEIDGIEVRHFRRKALALRIGLLSQITETYFSYTVYETVALGRYAHLRGSFSSLSQKDRDVVVSCLQRVGLLEIAQRRVNELSGGQQQRVFLARLFAQNPDIVLLDEPTNHLDLKHQIELLEFVTDWSQREKKTVIGVLHDLNLVYAYAQRVALMDDGRIFALAPPGEALCDDNLRVCYQADIAAWMRRSLANWN